MQKKPFISLVIYANKRKENLSSSLTALKKLNLNEVEVILINDNAIKDVKEIVDLFLLSNLKNVTYVNNQETLGQAFCFNMALKMALGQYIYFFDANHILEANFVSRLKKEVGGETTYDVISLKGSEDPLFSLKDKEINQLSNELILHCASIGIKALVFRKDFLLEKNLLFENLCWYPAVFLVSVLIKFKNWLNLSNSKNPFLSFKKESVFEYNIYDYLYQIHEFFKIITQAKVYEPYKEAFNFWITIICVLYFIRKIYKEYAIKISDKESLKKNKQIIKTAINHIINIINRYVPQFEENAYFIKVKPEITKYFLMSCKIVGLIR